MEDKEAIEILTQLIEKYPLSEKEKEAVSSAIGALGWMKLGNQRIKNIIRAKKAEKKKEKNWKQEFNLDR